MCSNFTYFAITSLIRSHILEFGSDKNTCSPFNLRFTSYALYQPFMRAFVEVNLLRLIFISITQKFNVPVVMSQLWILLVAVAQIVVMIIFSSNIPVLLYCYKFSHGSLATLWLLVSFQRSAGVSGKLGLVRKNTWKTLRTTLYFILIFYRKKSRIHQSYDKIIFIYQFTYIFTHLPIYSLFLYFFKAMQQHEVRYRFDEPHHAF